MLSVLNKYQPLTKSWYIWGKHNTFWSLMFFYQESIILQISVTIWSVANILKILMGRLFWHISVLFTIKSGFIHIFNLKQNFSKNEIVIGYGASQGQAEEALWIPTLKCRTIYFKNCWHWRGIGVLASREKQVVC